MGAPSAAGDTIPAECQVIEVRVAELRQLFNAIDPSPFRDRDLDPRAEEFIVGWARDVPGDAPLALLVHLERSAGQAGEAPLLGESVHRVLQATRYRLTTAAPGALSARPHQPGDRSRCSSAHRLRWETPWQAFFATLTLQKSSARDFSSSAGWPCGARWKCSCTTGGRFERRLASSTD